MPSSEAAVWRDQILADLHQARTDLQARLDYNTEALVFGEEALRLMTEKAPLDEVAAWNLVLGAFQAGQIWPYRLTGPAFRQVQNAGGLGLVADNKTIVTLSHLYDVTAHDFELVSGGLPKYRDIIRERLPWPLQEYIWDAGCQAEFLREGTADFHFRLVRCESPPMEELIRSTAQELRRSDSLIRALRGRLSQLKISVSSTARTIERVDNAAAQLQAAK